MPNLIEERVRWSRFAERKLVSGSKHIGQVLSFSSPNGSCKVVTESRLSFILHFYSKPDGMTWLYPVGVFARVFWPACWSSHQLDAFWCLHILHYSFSPSPYGQQWFQHILPILVPQATRLILGLGFKFKLKLRSPPFPQLANLSTCLCEPCSHTKPYQVRVSPRAILICYDNMTLLTLSFTIQQFQFLV